MGAGKSVVIDYLKSKHMPVLKLDEMAHELLVEPSIQKRLIKAFGQSILDTTTMQVDRKQLAQCALQSLQTQARLHQILHPPIWAKTRQWFNELECRNDLPVAGIVEIPLLFETQLEHQFDFTVCVVAPQAVRYKRLKNRGWVYHEIVRREKLQWLQSEKAQRSDWVISNPESKKKLLLKVDQWLKELKKVVSK